VWRKTLDCIAPRDVTRSCFAANTADLRFSSGLFQDVTTKRRALLGDAVRLFRMERRAGTDGRLHVNTHRCSCDGDRSRFEGPTDRLRRGNWKTGNGVVNLPVDNQCVFTPHLFCSFLLWNFLF
jgi:hypothetical protein